MKIFSWNCQGLANPDTINSLRNWCWKDRPNIVFLMETMIDDKKLERVKKRCGYNDGVCVSSNGNSGGIGFWWKNINVQTKSYSAHHFEVDVLDEANNPYWKAVGIYGWSESSNKHYTWELMKSLVLNSTIPIILFGDFNEILNLSEKQGGAKRSSRNMEDFCEVIDTCNLRDLGFKGNFFTWQRGNSPSTLIRERLDRFLASMSWCSLFPEAVVVNLHIHNSDHGPILLKEEVTGLKKNKERLLKFESLWLSSDECHQVVKNAWEEDRHLELVEKIPSVLKKIDSWAKDTLCPLIF